MILQRERWRTGVFEAAPVQEQQIRVVDAAREAVFLGLYSPLQVVPCADDVVVFNTESCTLFSLDANTGKHLWSYYLGDPLTSTPTIGNGRVYTSIQCNLSPDPNHYHF